MVDDLKFRQVKNALGMVCKFFAALGLRMDIQFDPHVKTVTADGRRLRFNPGYFAALDFDHAVGIVAQKAFQCAANHPIRMINRDPTLANIASQYVANPEILDAGYLLPDDHLYNEMFRGMSFERVYNILEQMWQDKCDNPDQAPQEGDENPIVLPPVPNAAAEPDDDEGSGDEQPAGGDDGDGDSSADETGDEQTAAGGNDGADGGGGTPADQDDYGGCGSIQPPRDNDGNSCDSAELSAIQADWNVALREAEMVVRRIGDRPGASVTLSKPLNDGRQDWREIVRRWMRSIQARNYSWYVPDRRFRHLKEELYLPSLHTKRLGRLGIGSDTSASVMTARQIRLITDEMNAVMLETMPQHTTVVYCDTVVQAVDEYTDREYPIELYLKGGGGTKVSPIFDWFEAQDVPPIGLIIFTDLAIDDFPAIEPAYPVLWASTGEKTAPFGEVVYLGEI